MTVRLNAYLNFRDSAREAMEFYRSVFGGELSTDTYSSMGMSDDPAEADKVMHSQLLTDDGLVLMAADVPNSMDLPEASSIHLSLSGDDEATLTGYFEALTDGGTVVEPLAKAPWGDTFGMCVDRFGTSWLFNIGSSPT